MKIKLIIGLLAINSYGCASHHYYEGRIKAADSMGAIQEHLLYWGGTKKKGWFDTVDGSIQLQSGCSLDIQVYSPGEEGLVFGKRETDMKKIEGPGCGKVMGFTDIKSIPEGPLEISVLCEPEVNEFAVGDTNRYLAARKENYRFTIKKRNVKDPVAEGPQRPACTP